MKKTKKKPATQSKTKRKTRKPVAKKLAKTAKPKAKVISLKSRTRKAPQKAEKKPAPVSPGEFMRKLLELKEARRKKAAENRAHQHWIEPTRFIENRKHTVPKFAGPRRRAV